MAQPQQQQYVPPQFTHSGLQAATSPGLNFNIPPHKRQRLSSDQPQLSPQPSSPYSQSPYSNMSPNPSPSAPTASNVFPNVSLPPAYATSPGAAYNTPYSNSNSSLNMPQASSGVPNQSPYQQSSSNFQQPNMSQGNQPPNFNNYGPTTPGAGTMGPPSKPADKGKEDGVDPMDVLGGTGVDLREEEQYSFQMINNSFNSNLSGSQSGTISSGHSYGPPGDEKSFFGAGPANAAAEKVTFGSQDEFHQYAANKAWDSAAHAISRARADELQNPFLDIAFMHAKMQKVARENGLGLNTDKTGMMGHMKLPAQFENRGVKVQTMGGSRGFMTVTKGGFVPEDSMLVDQLALLSVATKQRLRGLLEDANKLAIGRQTGSHGIIPEDWADAAAPMVNTDSSVVADGALRSGWDSAVSPHSSQLKRSFSEANKMPTPVSDSGKTPVTTTKVTNEVVAALRQTAVKERDFEEARLKKRLARNNGEVVSTPRQSSIIPGTPGSVAPESSEKAPTKKEQKKKAEAKVNEAASHAAANVTTAQFLGGGGGLFGKKAKKYSWLTAGAGGPGSGASTPGRINTQGLPGTPAAANAGPERMTADGARRMGSWREDRDKGKNIQIRDWITVLESDGHDKRSLQRAYMNLDTSDPK